MWSARRDIGDDARVAVAAQRVLQQARELAVAVRHAGIATIEGINDFAEHKERSIDCARLLEALAAVFGATVVLGASKIDKMDLAKKHAVRGGNIGLRDLWGWIRWEENDSMAKIP